MKMAKMIFKVLFLGIFALQVIALKQKTEPREPAASRHQQPQQTQQFTQLRYCGCDELKRCHNDQLNKDRDLLSRCRHECGSRYFLDGTFKKVVHCYEERERTKSDAETRWHQCLENFGNRRCIGDTHHSIPQSITVNTTEYLHSGARRNHNRKLLLPDPLHSLNSCVKTCVRNQGVVQFNTDGSILKSKNRQAENGENANVEKQHKNKKDYDSNCATQLNCQLPPLDKKLDKHSKNLCKFQSTSHEDEEMRFCKCLETALGQNFHCTDQLSPPESCSSTISQCASNKN